jgi:glycosyltransferase involved in cell wall biosynthesis
MYPTESHPLVGTFVRAQVEALRGLGVHLDLVAQGGRPARRIAAAGKYFRILRDTRSALRRARYDLVHAHYLFPTATIAVHAAGRQGPPVLITAHGSDVTGLPGAGWLRRRLSTWTLRRAAGVVAVSGALRDQLVGSGSIGTGKVDVVNMGVDTRTFRAGDRRQARRELGIVEDGVHAVMIALKFRPKGGFVLLEALARLRSELPAGTLVHFVGVTASPEIDAEVERLGLRDHVRFHGPRPHEEIPRWLRAADVFLLPSFSEGLPISVLEAMASEVAVIASSVGGIPEIVRTGENGMLVRAGDAESLAAALQAALRDPPLRERLGSAARRTAEENSVENGARAIRSIYERFAPG